MSFHVCNFLNHLLVVSQHDKHLEIAPREEKGPGVAGRVAASLGKTSRADRLDLTAFPVPIGAIAYRRLDPIILLLIPRSSAMPHARRPFQILLGFIAFTPTVLNKSVRSAHASDLCRYFCPEGGGAEVVITSLIQSAVAIACANNLKSPKFLWQMLWTISQSMDW